MPRDQAHPDGRERPRLFRGTYRVDTIRLPGYDYRQPGWYFVTIYTKDRLHLFGEVRGGIMGLNGAGCTAHACWTAIPDHVPRVRLDAFVVMPNHVHGLIGLAPDDPVSGDDGPGPGDAATAGDAASVAALHATPLRERPDASPDDADPDDVGARMAQISPAAGSLSAVVRSYKSAVTRDVRRAGAAFA